MIYLLYKCVQSHLFNLTPETQFSFTYNIVHKMMIANDGVLILKPRLEISRTKLNLPIDLFFTSLAEVHQSHAIGVVLSGTASDGTAGLKAIKDYGGITFAQDEASAAFEGMPHSAAEAGVVDFILTPEEIPLKILELNKRIFY